MLAQLLEFEIGLFFLLFVRIGAAVSFMPAFGESFVNARTRLAIALLLTLVLFPSLAPRLPALPDSSVLLVVVFAGEAAVGFFLGLTARTVMTALSVAGMVIATVSGLANALTNDPTSAQQASIVGSILTMLGLLVVVILDLHHLLLLAIFHSYEIFVPGEVLASGDMATMMAKTVTAAFALGFQLAAPFIALSMTFYLGLGLISRLMPTMQIFFIALPLQIVLGLLLLALLLPMLIAWFVTGYQGALAPFAGLS